MHTTLLCVGNQFIALNFYFMKRIIRLTGLIIFLLHVQHCFSQITHSVKGIVTDSLSKKPVDLATVSLEDSARKAVKVAITKNDGSFNLSQLHAGKYALTITSVNNNVKTIPVDLSDSSKPDVDLGQILLQATVGQLKAVTVTAKAKLVKQEDDRIIYNLQADPESNSNSVLEMMRKVPLLSMDADDNILLKGSNSYRIFINGKPSGMIERNPKQVLRSIPASTIQSIEVITSPSAKYDAEGLAGIINIVTSKKIDNGYNGTVNFNHRFPAAGPGAGVSFSFRENKFAMSVLAGGSIENVPETRGSNKLINTGDSPTTLDQFNTRETNSRSGYLGSELSFEIDSLDLISGQFNLGGNKFDGTSGQNTRLSNAGGEDLQQYNLLNNNNGNGSSIDAALNYQRGFKSSKDRLLTFSYRYLKNANTRFDALNVSQKLNYDQPDYQQRNDGRFTENTFQVDYVQPFHKVNMEAGVKAIFRTNASGFEYRDFDTLTGKFEINPALSNQFSYNQDVLAAYNTYTYKLTDWSFKAGVRVEKTNIKSDYIAGATQVKQNYFNVVPSISINRKLDEVSNLSLSYTNRLQRPAIAQLNPFVDRSNPKFEVSGNPDLNPTFTNMFQLSYLRSKKATINVVVGYMFFKSLIGAVSSYDDSTGITRTTFQNMGSGKVLRSNYYFSMPLTRAWSLLVNSDIRFGSFSTLINGQKVKNEGWMEYLNISTGYKFNKGWRADASFTQSNRIVAGPQTIMNPFVSSSFSINKDDCFLKNLSLSIAVLNPFTKYRRSLEDVKGPGFIQTRENYNYFRAFKLNLNYRFGKLKESVKKNKRSINNDDLFKS